MKQLKLLFLVLVVLAAFFSDCYISYGQVFDDIDDYQNEIEPYGDVRGLDAFASLDLGSAVLFREADAFDGDCYQYDPNYPVDFPSVDDDCRLHQLMFHQCQGYAYLGFHDGDLGSLPWGTEFVGYAPQIGKYDTYVDIDNSNHNYFLVFPTQREFSGSWDYFDDYYFDYCDLQYPPINYPACGYHRGDDDDDIYLIDCSALVLDNSHIQFTDAINVGDFDMSSSVYQGEVLSGGDSCHLVFKEDISDDSLNVFCYYNGLEDDDSSCIVVAQQDGPVTKKRSASFYDVHSSKEVMRKSSVKHRAVEASSLSRALGTPGVGALYNHLLKTPLFAFSSWNAEEQQSSSTVIRCGQENCLASDWGFVSLEGAHGPVSIVAESDGREVFFAASDPGTSTGVFQELSDLLYWSDCDFSDSEECSSSVVASDVYPNFQVVVDSNDHFHRFGYRRVGAVVELVYTFCLTAGDSCTDTVLDVSDFTEELTGDHGYPLLQALIREDNTIAVVAGMSNVIKVWDCRPSGNAAPFACDGYNAMELQSNIDFIDASYSTNSILHITYTYRPSPSQYTVRIVSCFDGECSKQNAYEIAGDRYFWHQFTGAVPSGIQVLTNVDANNGNPIIAFATGSSSGVGGPIAMVACHNEFCSSASLIKTSDYLAGHVGDFEMLVTDNYLLVASPQQRGSHWSAAIQQFYYKNAMPDGELCGEDNTGRFRSLDDVVMVCSKIDSGLARDATQLYYWSPLVPEIRTLHTSQQLSASHLMSNGCGF